jgi:hypothetical protein
MTEFSLSISKFALPGLIAAAALLGSKAHAAVGDYYAATTISNVPVLWIYTPPGSSKTASVNKLKLCYPSGSTLACTAGIAAFAAAPAATDTLEYRLSQIGGALWIVDSTSATASSVLCEATLSNNVFSLSCARGTGLD